MTDDLIIVEAMPPVPSSIDDVARQQIRKWLQSTGTNQVAFAAQIERNQEWVSRYLNGHFDADLTTLARMADVFGHNLATLFGSLPSSPDEAALLMMFRGLRPEGRRARLGLDLLDESLRPYDWTRHTFGTEVYRRTHDLKMVTELLGHSDLSQADIYAQSAVREHVRAAVTELDKFARATPPVTRRRRGNRGGNLGGNVSPPKLPVTDRSPRLVKRRIAQ